MSLYDDGRGSMERNAAAWLGHGTEKASGRVLLAFAREQDALVAALRAQLADAVKVLEELAKSAEAANNYSTRNEHFNLPQVGEGYIKTARAVIAAAKQEAT